MIFSPFAYRHKTEGVGPTPTPTPTPSATPQPTGPTPTPSSTPTPTPTPSTVTWKYRYIASNEGTTRQKTASNLYFNFNGQTYTRSNRTYIGGTNSLETITTDTNTGTGQFEIYRDLCRGTGGSGTPRIADWTVKVYRNGSVIYNNNTDPINIVIPVCPTKDSQYEGTGGGYTVSAGDEIIVEWSDNLTV